MTVRMFDIANFEAHKIILNTDNSVNGKVIFFPQRCKIAILFCNSAGR